MNSIFFGVRAPVDLRELQDLFQSSWESGQKPNYEQVLERSFTWIAARDQEELVGFVNVAWDGGVHFFLLDTTVAPSHRGRGIGVLVQRAVEACRGHGEWLHVDSDEELMDRLYFPAGFFRAHAGTAAVAS